MLPYLNIQTRYLIYKSYLAIKSCENGGIDRMLEYTVVYQLYTTKIFH